jgi:hypothetical protein
MRFFSSALNKRRCGLAGTSGSTRLASKETISLNGVAEPIFTFDLPEQLVELYADNGVLTRRAASMEWRASRDPASPLALARLLAARAGTYTRCDCARLA